MLQLSGVAGSPPSSENRRITVKLVRWSCAFILMLSMSGIVLAKEKEKVIEGQTWTLGRSEYS